jgi:hypothetical protein
MRFGFLVPTSANFLGIAILIAVVGLFIYAIYYSVTNGSIRKLEKAFNEGVGSEPEVEGIFDILNFPESVGTYFKNRKIDLSSNKVTLYTDGVFAFALGCHKGLKVPKLFFRVVFSNNPIVHKFSIADFDGNEISELFLSAESSIFMEEDIRFYEISWKDLLRIRNSHALKILIHQSHLDLSHEESGQIRNAIQFCLDLKSRNSHSLLARGE